LLAALDDAKQRSAKEEAGPSPIRASRVWAQDDSKKRLRKAKAEVTAEDRPLKPKGRAPAKDRVFREL